MYEFNLPTPCRPCRGKGKISGPRRVSRAYTQTEDGRWEAPCRSCQQRGYRRQWHPIVFPKGVVIRGKNVRVKR